MAKSRKITIKKAATLMGKSELFLREGLRRGVFTFGEAFQMPGSTRWNFYIYPAEFAKYLGMTVEEVLAD